MTTNQDNNNDEKKLKDNPKDIVIKDTKSSPISISKESVAPTQPLLNNKHIGITVVGKIDLDSINETIRPQSKRKKRIEKKKMAPKNNIEENQNIYIPFSSLTFKNGKIFLNYNGKVFHQFFSKAEYCDYLTSRNREILPESEWERYASTQILVQLEYNKGKNTFQFVNFNLHGFIIEMCEKARSIMNSQSNTFLVNNTNQAISSFAADNDSLPTLHECNLNIENIEFRNGFYLIWVIKNGEKDSSIAPLRVDEPCSFASLRFVQKYLSDRFPQGIQILYSEKAVIELSEPYTLGDYIRELRDNINTQEKWWKELQNMQKPSLKQCRQVTIEESRKRVSLKNGYLDSLSSLQNNKKLIPIYEINHGKQEDAFLFTIDMSNNNCAIIFENISFASTATEVFIAKNENYESCIEMVFNYFTNYSIASKRESLRRGINPPERFYAEKHFAIYHYDLEQWMSSLFKKLEQPPKHTDIEFISGLNVPDDSKMRVVPTEEISIQNLHNKLMRKLYNKLCKEYGATNVGTEIRVGEKRIDTVVKLDNCYDIYEIKTTSDPFSCVTLALGQLCQYAYLFCRDKIGRMVIVGPAEITKEANDYLAWFRKTYSLQVYYLYLHV